MSHGDSPWTGFRAAEVIKLVTNDLHEPSGNVISRACAACSLPDRVGVLYTQAVADVTDVMITNDLLLLYSYARNQILLL